MADIHQILTQIKTAIFGKDVRQAIHDGVELAYNNSSDAIKTANSVNAKATQAMADAADAKTVANGIDAKATQAMESAETAKSTAADALKLAGTARNDAAAASAAAKAAQDTADAAKTVALGADSKAEDAKSKADDAFKQASQAITDAEDAGNAAKAAQDTADAAKTVALAAETTAGEALNQATKARTAAEDAETTAGEALNQATKARTAADEAGDAAKAAQDTADDAMELAENLRDTKLDIYFEQEEVPGQYLMGYGPKAHGSTGDGPHVTFIRILPDPEGRQAAKIGNVMAPTLANEAANKDYVDTTATNKVANATIPISQNLATVTRCTSITYDCSALTPTPVFINRMTGESIDARQLIETLMAVDRMVSPAIRLVRNGRTNTYYLSKLSFLGTQITQADFIAMYLEGALMQFSVMHLNYDDNAATFNDRYVGTNPQNA